MRTKSLSGLPVGFTFMPFIMVFIEAANALSAGKVAGFIVMPFMSSAPALSAGGKSADMTRAARNVDFFMMRSFQRERPWRVVCGQQRTLDRGGAQLHGSVR